MNLALGLLLGPTFSTCYILLRERNDASLRSPGQSVKHLNVPELAVIPSARIGNSERIPLTLRNLIGVTALADGKNSLARRQVGACGQGDGAVGARTKP